MKHIISMIVGVLATAVAAAAAAPMEISQTWEQQTAHISKTGVKSDTGGPVTEPVHTPGQKAFQLRSGLPGHNMCRFSPSPIARLAEVDLSAFQGLRAWIHNPAPVPGKLVIKITCTDPTQPKVGTGRQMSLPLDWTGWKEITVRFDQMSVVVAPGEMSKTRVVDFGVQNPADFAETATTIVITEVQATQ